MSNGTKTRKGFIPHLRAHGISMPVALRTRRLADGSRAVVLDDQDLPEPEFFGAEMQYATPGGGRVTASQVGGGFLCEKDPK